MEMINCIRVVVNTFRISSCPPFTDKVPAFPWTFPLQTTGLILYSRALLYNRETDKCIVNLYFILPFISAGNNPPICACVYSWRQPRGPNTLDNLSCLLKNRKEG